MTIRQRGDSYTVDLTYDDPVTGKEKRLRRDFATEKVAKLFEAAALAALFAGNPIPDTTPAGQAAKPKATHVRTRQPNTSTFTLADALKVCWETDWKARNCANRLYGYGKDVLDILGHDTPVASLTGSASKMLVASGLSKGNKPATVNKLNNALSKLCSVAVDGGHILAVPPINWLKPNNVRHREYTREEEDQIISAAEILGLTDMADAVKVLIDTGIRRGELLKAKGSWVQSNKGTPVLRIPHDATKTGKPRAIPLTTRAAGILQQRAAKSGTGKPLFPELDITKVNNGWARIRKKCGAEGDETYVTHSLRHTFASRLIQRGVGLSVVSQLLGHSNIQMTTRYAWINTDMSEDAIRTLERV